jgi:hypothetical protein
MPEAIVNHVWSRERPWSASLPTQVRSAAVQAGVFQATQLKSEIFRARKQIVVMISANPDSHQPRAGRLALRRIFHGQYPPPAHAPSLCPGVRTVFRLVRTARPDACCDPATRRRHLYRATADVGSFGAVGQAATHRCANAVRLAHRRPSGPSQSGAGRPRAKARRQDWLDAARFWAAVCVSGARLIDDLRDFTDASTLLRLDEPSEV